MAGPFTYALIPQATDQLSVSQGQILTNFTSIQSLIDVDHVDFSSVDAGKHNQVTLVRNGSAPTFGATEFALFNAPEIPVPNTLQMWINNPTNLAVTQIPLSKSTLNINAAPGPGGPIYTYLPSGFIIQTGSFSAASSGVVQNFPIAFPNQIISVTISLTNPLVGSVISVGASNVTTTGFTVRAAQFSGGAFIAATNPVNGNYIAVGY